jgi:hypothetical protein
MSNVTVNENALLVIGSDISGASIITMVNKLSAVGDDMFVLVGIDEDGEKPVGFLELANGDRMTLPHMPTEWLEEALKMDVVVLREMEHGTDAQREYVIAVDRPMAPSI